MKKIRIDPREHFRVLESTERSQVAEMVLGVGQSTGGPENRHAGSDQWLYVVSGEGKAVIDGEKVAFEQGDLLLIEADETHEVVNTGDEDLRTFSIYAPKVY